MLPSKRTGAVPLIRRRRSQTKRVCQYANVLKKYGIGKGDRVIIYMVRPSAPALLCHLSQLSHFSPPALPCIHRLTACVWRRFRSR